MTAETATALQAAADEIGIDCTTRDNYSGRHMYGDKTHAIVVTDMSDVCMLAACAARTMTQEERTRDCEEFIDELQNLKTDGMGRDSIVVY